MIYSDIAIVMLAAKYAMDEFILCSVLLYVDIMRMLFYLLLILGKSKWSIHFCQLCPKIISLKF